MPQFERLRDARHTEWVWQQREARKVQLYGRHLCTAFSQYGRAPECTHGRARKRAALRDSVPLWIIERDFARPQRTVPRDRIDEASEAIAQAITEEIGRKVSYRPVDQGAAERVASRIAGLL